MDSTVEIDRSLKEELRLLRREKRESEKKTELLLSECRDVANQTQSDYNTYIVIKKLEIEHNEEK